jgi:hypothetical protein
MPINGMNTGQDYQLFFFDGATGNLVPLGDVQSVSIKQTVHTIRTSPYNNPTRYGFVPDGYHITFQITRTGPELENFLVAAENNFNSNGAIQKPGVLQQTVLNNDGSFSRYQYTSFVIYMPDHGEISKDKAVTLSLEGHASEKKPIA